MSAVRSVPAPCLPIWSPPFQSLLADTSITRPPCEIYVGLPSLPSFFERVSGSNLVSIPPPTVDSSILVDLPRFFKHYLRRGPCLWPHLPGFLRPMEHPRAAVA